MNNREQLIEQKRIPGRSSSEGSIEYTLFRDLLDPVKRRCQDLGPTKGSFSPEISCFIDVLSCFIDRYNCKNIC